MKRILSVILAAGLLLSNLTGCAKEDALDPAEPVTLTMWHVYGEQASSPMNELVEEFNATEGQKQGILVSVTNVTSASKLDAQLQKALAGKPDAPQMPDLFSAHAGTVVDLGAEHFLDWDAYFSAEELEKFVPLFVDGGRVDGRLLVFPISKSTFAVFLNGSQFARFSADTGVSYDDLSTWEGFFDAAAKYYGWSGGTPFCGFDYLIRHVELDMMAESGNTLPYYASDGWYDLENPYLKKSWMKFAVPLLQGHISMPKEYANTLVMTGETLGSIGSSAAINYYNDTVTYPDNTSEPMNVKVLPLPKTGDGQQYMPVTGVGLSAYPTTEQKAKAAAVFVRWLTEGERNLNFVAETGYMPVTNDAFEAIADYDFPDEGHAELFRAIKLMREEYIPTVHPIYEGYSQKVNTLYAGLRKMLPGLQARAAQGEDAQALAEETWRFFCSIR